MKPPSVFFLATGLVLLAFVMAVLTRRSPGQRIGISQ
jgi:hypothetical protein